MNLKTKLKQLFARQKKPSFAFSLIETSVVILIIGIVVAGVFAANSLIAKTRITAAQNATKAAPVNSIRGNVLWLESSLESSFDSTESNTGSAVTTWYDNNPQKNIKNNASQSTSGNKPTYSNTINNIHAVKFDGTNSYFNIDGSELNGTDYTIFVVEKRLSNKSSGYFIGDSSSTTSNQTLLLGYSRDGQIIHSQGSGNSYNSAVGSYSNDTTPRIFAFIQNSSSGKKAYVNGMLSGQSSDVAQLSNLSTIAVGKNYHGELGEVIAFNKALSDAERKDVEKYLSGKWMIKNFDTSCTNGIALASGCDTNSCAVSVNGVGTGSVSSGSGSLSCSDTGYSGTVNYTCTSGTLSTSGSCSCASGYALVGGQCRGQCVFNGYTGIPNNTSVSYTTTPTSRTCTASGYSGTVQYTCDGLGGSPVVTSGSCQPKCSVNITGVSTTSVNSGASGTFTCSGNYTGSVTYSCTSGTLTTSGSCSPLNCPVSIIGVSTTTVAPGSGTLTCDQYSYSGSISYTCSGGVLSRTATCTGQHWSYVGGFSTFRAVYLNNGNNNNGGMTMTCGSIQNGSYAYSYSYASPPSSSTTMTFGSGSANGQGWFSCYCTTPSCTPSCGAAQITLSDVQVYKCSY